MKTSAIVARFSVCSLAILLLSGAGQAWAANQRPLEPVDSDTPEETGSGGTLGLGSSSTAANASVTNASGVLNIRGATTTGNAGTLTGATLSNGTLSAINFNGGVLQSGAGTLALTGSNTYSGATSLKFPVLSGSAGDLKITTTPDGNLLRVKTAVAVSNTGTKAAKNVTATVYLSDDAVLDADDTKLATLKLADYFSGVTKLARGQTLSLPIKHKVPAAVASVLEGKYLIVVLDADSASLASLATLSLGATTTANFAGNFVQTPAIPLTGGGIPTFGTASTGGTLTLTATGVNTFRVNTSVIPSSGAVGTVGSIASLQTASTGNLLGIVAGTTVTAQPGDVLTLAGGNTLTAVSQGTWRTVAGSQLTIMANVTLASGVLTGVTTPPISAVVPTTTVPIVAATPKNEVIIGPIKLP